MNNRTLGPSVAAVSEASSEAGAKQDAAQARAEEALRRTGRAHYGFGLADDPGDCLGAVLEDVGGDDGVHRHVGAQDQRRHPAGACSVLGLGSPLPLRLRCWFARG